MAPLATPTSSSSSAMKPTLLTASRTRSHSFKKNHKLKHHKIINLQHSSSASASASASFSEVTATAAAYEAPSSSSFSEVAATAVDEAVAAAAPSPSSSASCCSTPKGQKFRIPEISTCPPAPKKKIKLSNHFSSSPISFFAPPDLELFFFLSLPAT